jgi:branched-subunit amino acid aminotransferase/4-amino-4-deoxychorismate lyase
MVVYYNDKLIKEACLSPTNQGFQFGYGVFETILISKGVPCFVDMHYRRLIKGCHRLGLELKLDIEEIYNGAIMLSEACNITEGRLKVICFRDVENDAVMMTLSDYRLEESIVHKGMTLGISNIMRNPHSPMCYLKSLNYAENILAKAEAKSQGYDKALFLNVSSKLCDGAVSNIFWTKDHVLYTPEIACGILEGITRRQVIDICKTLGFKHKEGSYDLGLLLQADEVFVTNSLMGIMPVCRVDNTTYNISEYKISIRINNEYRKLIENEINNKRRGK